MLSSFLAYFEISLDYFRSNFFLFGVWFAKLTEFTCVCKGLSLSPHIGSLTGFRVLSPQNFGARALLLSGLGLHVLNVRQWQSWGFLKSVKSSRAFLWGSFSELTLLVALSLFLSCCGSPDLSHT